MPFQKRKNEPYEPDNGTAKLDLCQKNQSLIGSSLDMLVEGIDEEQDILVGRSYRDAPEIDGLIVAQGSAQVGEMAKIQIESSGPYDLFGSQIK